MKTTEEIQAKIKRFEEIKKIVLSMKSIAALNIQKSQHIIAHIRAYEDEINLYLTRILGYFPNLIQSFKEGDKVLIVFGSDQGLCGLFNEKLVSYIGDYIENFKGLIVVGKKLDDIIGHKKFKVLPAPVDLEAIYAYASELVEYIAYLYEDNVIHEVYVAYNNFLGVGKYSPVFKRIIPCELEKEKHFEYPPIVDISPREIFIDILTEYIFSNIYKAYLESFLSENGVRLMNMNNASKSIEKNIKQLEIERNYYRQEEITNEIQEILTAYKVLVE